jgi:selenocysteine-specific translation elongation factor
MKYEEEWNEVLPALKEIVEQELNLMSASEANGYGIGDLRNELKSYPYELTSAEVKMAAIALIK